MLRRLLVVLATASAILLLVLLARASSNTSDFARYYWWLVGLNSAVALALASLLAREILGLRHRLKQRVFGATLSLRLVLMFIAVAVIPGLLVYTASLRFLNRSIETWFNVKVDKALERSVDLGYAAFTHSQNELLQQARMLANRVAETPNSEIRSLIEETRNQIGADEGAIFSEKGQALLVAGSRPQLFTVMLDPSLMGRLKLTHEYQATESQPGGLAIRVVAPIYPKSLTEPMRWLQLIKAVPSQLVADAELVESVQADYKLLSQSREGLKVYYTITLTLTLIVVLFSVLVLAFYLSRRLSDPLSDLAEGAKAIASGDFSKRQRVRGRDELGSLTHLFNRMTRQLAEARQSVEREQARVESARAHLETVLNNLSSGVLAFNRDGLLKTANAGASQIIGLNCAGLVGQPLNHWPDLVSRLTPLAEVLAQHRQEAGEWTAELDFGGPQLAQHLLLHGAPLPGDEGGFVVVFDDISDLIAAQRTAAWGEVAKRLAHEIRNPLTPIQLSAERLEMKLSGKLAAADQELLSRNIRTIINQVAALKTLVDAFRDYAKAPTQERREIDLNTLVAEVLTLYETQRGLRLALDTVPFTITADVNGLRQVVHNLVRNAQDAISGIDNPQILVSTHREGDMAILEIEDNGAGFDEALLSRIFEPYVTTKPKGTGLGLAIIKKIIDEHQGRIEIGNRAPQGARIRIAWPLVNA